VAGLSPYILGLLIAAAIIAAVHFAQKYFSRPRAHVM